MTTYRLEKLFAPRSIAVVGASPRQQSVGRKILTNLKRAGFAGPIRLVNPRYAEIEGIRPIKTMDELPETDLLVIASPPPSVPAIIATAGARGCAAAVIISSGLGQGEGSLSEAARQAAHAHGMRLLGPNCLGIQVPRMKLDASFAAHMGRSGELALISQSGGIAAGTVEWTARRSVGFSAIVSLGNQADVDFGDLLDYFAEDRSTRAVLLYIESVQSAPKFMSAARAAARSKPVIVIKSGRHTQGAVAARTHTGALAGADAVYDAAFRRAGLVRAFDLDELFDAAETLGHIRPFPGNRLAILTNGGGMGILAVDRLIDLGGQLAELSNGTLKSLIEKLPPIWSKANPVDIVGDADGTRYAASLDVLLTDPANDGVLVINVPTALASASDAADAVASAVNKYQKERYPKKPVFAAWVGDDGSSEAKLGAAGIPCYESEGNAVRSFMHLVHYRERLDALMATPPSFPSDFLPDTQKVRTIVRHAVEDGRAWLDPVEIANVMASYGIPVASVSLARDPAEAVALAEPLLANGAVALKILSPDIVHKSDIGGVRLNLVTQAEVREAAEHILNRVRSTEPGARIMGLTVHPMIVRPRARELIAGIANDTTFGPVIVFGSGGTAVEVMNDKALALPPLDLALAHDLIYRTRVSRLLDGYRDVPAADTSAVARVLVKLSQLAADVPEIRELDLNPLLADDKGVMALDARVAVAEAPRGWRGHPRFAIRPYPREWERHTRARDGTPILVRPVRPEDEPLYIPFLSMITPEDLRLRFFAPVRNFTHAFIARFTQIDYARAMAFVIIQEPTGEMLGVGRLHIMTHSDAAEFAVLVRSDLKNQGLGWLLMQTLMEYARAEGIREIVGDVLADNTMMLRMCAELGFTIVENREDPSVRRVQFHLASPAAFADLHTR